MSLATLVQLRGGPERQGFWQAAPGGSARRSFAGGEVGARYWRLGAGSAANSGGCQDVGEPGLAAHRLPSAIAIWAASSGCLRRDHQQDHAVLGCSWSPDGVGVHMAEPAHAVDDRPRHAAGHVPGVQLRDPGDRPKGCVQARDEARSSASGSQSVPPAAVHCSCSDQRGSSCQPQPWRPRRSGEMRSGCEGAGCMSSAPFSVLQGTTVGMWSPLLVTGRTGRRCGVEAGCGVGLGQAARAGVGVG